MQNYYFEYERLFSKGSVSEEVLSEFLNAAKIIGNAGWTIPYFLEISFLNRISKDNINEEGINSLFFDEFTKCKDVNTLTLLDLIKSELSDKYKMAFDETCFAYKNEKYILCTCVLYAVIDGLVKEYNGKDKKGVNVEGVKATKLGDMNSPLIFAHIKSVNIFLSHHFRSGGDSIEGDIHRNNLLHGFSFSSDKITCIKLFNCIYSILFINRSIQHYEALIDNKTVL